VADRKLDQAILDAAERLIVEEGYEGIKPDAVAAAAGLSFDGPPPSSWDLFAAVMLRDEARFNARVDAAIEAASDPGGQLLGLIEACVIDHDWTFWIELWSIALREQAARDLREQLESAFRARVEGLIEEGRKSGEFEVEDPRAVAIAISTLIDALAVGTTLGDDTVSPNFMLDASASVSGRLVGAELKLRRSDDA
jgi:AcrR family transcriptional regulator